MEPVMEGFVLLRIVELFLRLLKNRLRLINLTQSLTNFPKNINLEALILQLIQLAQLVGMLLVMRMSSLKIVMLR